MGCALERPIGNGRVLDITIANLQSSNMKICRSFTDYDRMSSIETSIDNRLASPIKLITELVASSTHITSVTSLHISTSLETACLFAVYPSDQHWQNQWHTKSNTGRQCHPADGSQCIGTSSGGLNEHASITWPCASVASAHHPLARRSPHDGGLAGLLKRP